MRQEPNYSYKWNKKHNTTKSQPITQKKVILQVMGGVLKIGKKWEYLAKESSNKNLHLRTEWL